MSLDWYSPNQQAVWPNERGPAIDDVVDLDAMSKAELIAEVERRGVDVAPGATKAQLLAALHA
jgi:hypothetical protein